MTPPDANGRQHCHLCDGYEFRISVCDEHLAKVRAGFVPADGDVVVPRATLENAVRLFWQGEWASANDCDDAGSVRAALEALLQPPPQVANTASAKQQPKPKSDPSKNE